MQEFVGFLIVGFLAQLVDVALGMAYGIISTTLLLSIGLPPVVASATTHAAECVTTGFSAFAHHQFGNVDRTLFRRLVLPGMIGSIVGAYALSHIEGDVVKPYIALYLFAMGIIIIVKVFREFPPGQVTRHLIPLGFAGALMDAIGGGGWGPIVTSTLLVRGNDVRTTIGSVNACEFFIALTASLAFFLSGVKIGWEIILALALGGAIAAPFGAWICKHAPHKPLLFLVGLLVIFLSSYVLWLSFFANK
jgi:uncharacterized membrane protein YfcA